MPLPTVADAKGYLRKETDDEDVLIGQLLARARTKLEGLIGYAFTAVQRTYVDYNGPNASILQLPGPFALSPAPVVTDVNGVTISSTTYLLDQVGGKIRGKSGMTLGAWPLTVVATIGLSAHPDYAAKYETFASLLILDLVAHYYQNRNPAVISQSDEGGASESLTPDSIPPRIVQDILTLPCTVGLVMA